MTGEAKNYITGLAKSLLGSNLQKEGEGVVTEGDERRIKLS
jgi:hypothetical protein